MNFKTSNKFSTYYFKIGIYLKFIICFLSFLIYSGWVKLVGRNAVVICFL